MTFIRAKEIPRGSGNWYDYEVETVHKGGKVIQKHIRYIGKSFGKPSGKASVSSDTATPDMTISPPRIHKMKTPSKHIASALGMYYGGMSLDAIQQQFRQDHDLDMSESNYWNWIERFTKAAIKQSDDFKPHVGSRWVADETYMKLGKRNVYFWDIIDADSRYLLATHVSFTRSGRDAKRLMDKASERAGKLPKVVVTDGLRSYISGIEDAYGADAKHHSGGPFNLERNTNLIERFHRTLEQRTKAFQKYKDIKSIRLLTNGWLINYNFFKQHEGCGNVPPAQAMSKVVPFKDWNDVVIPHGHKDMDYQVSLSRRRTVKKGKPVYDATLTPVEVSNNESA
jgi:putative transposase